MESSLKLEADQVERDTPDTEMLDLFGQDRILMGTDYPFDMAEYNPIGHIAGLAGIDDGTIAQLAGQNAVRVLGLEI